MVPGVEKKQVANEETYLTVDTTEAGDGSLAVIPCGPDEKALETTVTEEQKGVYNVKYIPKDAGEMNITVLFSDRDVPNSPFSVSVIDPSICRVYGPGVEEKQVAGEETHIMVDTTKAGDGLLMVNPCGADQVPLKYTLKEEAERSLCHQIYSNGCWRNDRQRFFLITKMFQTFHFQFQLWIP